MEDLKWKGMHNGIIKGKSFENSRRHRKSHSVRLAEIIAKESGNKSGRK